MAVVGAVAAVAGAVAGVGGTAFSIVQGQKASKAQKKATRLEQMRQEAEERRRRRQEIRRSRIARAQTLNAGVQVGGQDSSALAGGLGSLSSQLSSNIGFSNQQAGFNRAITGALGKAQDHTNSSNMFSGIANIGMNVFGAAGGRDAIKKGYTQAFGNG